MDSIWAAFLGFAYAAGSVVCHQLPERSFYVSGVQLPVCARCTALYLGGVAGMAVWATRWPLVRAAVGTGRRALALAAVAAAPTLLTLATAAVGAWDPGNAVRAGFALPLGLVAGAIVAAVAAKDLS
jgi:uncharacterized membrane protein